MDYEQFESFLENEDLVDWIYELKSCRNIQELKDVLKQIPENYVDEAIENMPVWGKEPKNLDGVWSWSSEYLLIGDRDNLILKGRIDNRDDV